MHQRQDAAPGLGREEKAIQNEILETLGVRRDLRLWRANVGVARPIGNPNAVVRFGVPGQADLSGILRGGRRLEIEVKAPYGVQSEQQRAFQAMVVAFGGLYIVARSAQEAVAAVDAALQGGSRAGSDPV